MKKFCAQLPFVLWVAVLVSFSACSSAPKPPAYSGDTYNQEKTEAFTLNFYLLFKRVSKKDADFEVQVLDRATGKEVDLSQREIVVYSKTPKNKVAVDKDKHSFEFKMNKTSDCFDGIFGIEIGDPRPALQKATVSLIHLCEKGL